ncbi:MAG: hypothetical protein CMM86_06990 [Rhodovulum sp.]|jgi:hypothetical protein|nr:hypothetical protein [Rhodovulum sp. FJ3]MAY32336.1 hypothetical protein [Rhodovulum sp.]MDV4168205.1 hypothetical protein [Rhodovulum sp. FJ3]MEC8631019.1 hypothetical protein [Pseudomonadota bacterium]MEC8796156.1 hypothetical protein [Pseudomonadota bacterium]|tara:strand:- start:798 stop:932 length:135 start_codon:yes stop_codon:yes gene_type:complete
MGRLIKALFFLVLLGFIGLVGFAYVGDLTPEREMRNEPVQLDVN